MPKRHRPGVSANRVLRHVEEIVVATSGEDTFEVVFAVAAARLTTDEASGPMGAVALRRAIAAATKLHPSLRIGRMREASNALLVRVDALLAAAGDSETALDAVFESLVPRVSKSDKGQFFTPRHVVDFVVRMLAPQKREVIIDPACGSGAFLDRARRASRRIRAYGSDVDPRAVRVARLLALAASADPATIHRADGLHADLPVADVIATNPPFAGRAPAAGFDVSRVVRSPERDVLFLERSLTLLRPGGRLGIVLPYNKASGAAFAPLRRWFAERARILAVVGLPRETFLPHTAQRTFVLFAQKRKKPGARSDEKTMLVVSERAGKDSAGEPIMEGDHLAHDLEEVASELGPFLRAEGFS